MTTEKKFRKQRIFFVHFYNSFSGSPRILNFVINSISDKECILITNNTEGFLSDLNVKKILFNFDLSSSKFVTLYRYFKAQLNIFFIVLKYCEKGDLLYINTTIPIFAGLAGRIKRNKILFHLHEDRSSLNFVHRIISKLRKYCCDVEIFVSYYLYEREHLTNKEFYILYNAIPKEFFEEGRNHNVNLTTNGIFNVLMICSLKRYKGIIEFFKIAEKFLFHQKNNIHFTLVIGATQKEIDSFMIDYSIPGNTTIHSQDENTISYYKNASILLNLSRPDEWVESFGLTILEGMSFVLPCIVPPIGGPAELIDDGINGFKISSYEIDLIYTKILEIYNDNSLYNLMSVNNKSKAKKFQIDAFQKKINTIIEESMS